MSLFYILIHPIFTTILDKFDFYIKEVYGEEEIQKPLVSWTQPFHGFPDVTLKPSHFIFRARKKREKKSLSSKNDHFPRSTHNTAPMSSI